MHTVLTIAIDPSLAAHRAPIAWILRETLVALGYSWREVAFGSRADVVYALEGGWSPASVRIESAGWDAPLPTGQAADRWVPVDVDDQGCRVVRRDLVRELFRAMTGADESSWATNAHGHLDVPPAAKGNLRVAIGSRLVRALGNVLVDAGVARGLPRWPSGAVAAAAFSHDVDYPEVVRCLEPVRVLRRQGWRGARAAMDVLTGRRHHWHFPTWMALERRLNVRSAFFFSAHRGSLAQYALGRPDPFYDIRAPRFAHLIRALVSEDWEVGLHASYDAWRDSSALVREKDQLEDVAQTLVSGVRHHYWRLDPSQPTRTLALHSQAGFLYDTTLTHDRSMGFRRGLAWPFRPWDPDTRRAMATIQLPTSWVDDHAFRHWKGSRDAAEAALDEVVDTVIDVGGCLLTNVHDYVVDPRLHPGYFALASGVLQLVAEDSRFWKATPTGVARHWQARQQACESASIGLAFP